MLQYDFEQSVNYWIVMASHALQKALNEELAHYGITLRQWQVLAWLAMDGDLTQSELAERMDLEAATLVSVLGRMERRGWISRLECEGDRRKRLIRPTEKVAPMWNRSFECVRRVRARAAEGIDPKDLETVKQVMARIRDNLQADVFLSNERET